MKKYLILYRVEGAGSGMSVSEMFANTPPEQVEAGMAMWTAWNEKCGDAMVDPGAPLDSSTLITSEGSEPNKTAITGYTILQAESLEAAKELMNGHPHFFMPGAAVEILEAVAIPGM